ncbi:MAG: hypothetical protein V4508_09140 [Pseudomonadota bacterium]
MAGNLAPLSNNGIPAGSQALARSAGPKAEAKAATAAFAELQAAQQQRAPQAVPQEAPAGNTRQIEKNDTAQQARRAAEESFLTRQDLAAKAASTPSPSAVGKNVDISV